MSWQGGLADALIGVGCLCVLASVLGLLLLRDPYERLHVLGPAAIGGALPITAAVVLEQGNSAWGIKTMLTALILCVFSPLVAHAIGRAIRLERRGTLAPRARGAGTRG